MSITKRLLSLVLCLLMIFSLVACNDNELESDSGSGIVMSAVPANYISIATAEGTNYKIVYQKDLALSVTSAIAQSVTAVKQKVGADMQAISDEALPAPVAGMPEILIGLTNRADSTTANSGLRAGDYRIEYIPATGNIVIAGGNDTALVTAINAFFNNNLNLNGRYLAVPNNYSDKQISSATPTSVTINGVPLKSYVVIYPSGADTVTKYAAQNLVDYAKNNLGVNLTMSDDSKAESQYEFLIGKTKRAASNISTTMKDGQYVLMQKDGKIVMQGNGIYVGAAVGAFVSKHLPSGAAGQKGAAIDNLPTTASAQTYTFPTTYKNAVIMIGDGMGFNHVEMAKAHGMTEFYAEQFPNKGKARTRSMTVINGKGTYTDSAAAATALATGYKTLNQRVGVDKDGKTLQNIRELAQSKGAKTAIVTSDVINGATPGGFLAHNAQRKINDVNNPKILEDINNLIKTKKVNYTMGRSKDDVNAPDPDILQGTREALSIIASGGSQFFMMIEGAYIDKDSHYGRYERCIKMVKQYNEVIAYMSTFVFCHPNTVLIVTADHETGALTKKSGSTYGYQYTNQDGTRNGQPYRQHTNNDVPVYALGPNTSYFNNKRVENVCIPHFAAKAFGNNNFGDPNYTKNVENIT